MLVDDDSSGRAQLSGYLVLYLTEEGLLHVAEGGIEDGKCEVVIVAQIEIPPDGAESSVGQEIIGCLDLERSGERLAIVAKDFAALAEVPLHSVAGTAMSGFLLMDELGSDGEGVMADEAEHGVEGGPRAPWERVLILDKGDEVQCVVMEVEDVGQEPVVVEH